MRIDKNAVNRLSALSDDKLWRVICALGSSSGIDLSTVKVSPKELDKVRLAMSQLTDDDIERATEIISTCKKQGKKFGGRYE